MHKVILNLFGFLKSCVQLIKILLVFSVLMLLLYWIQNLTGDSWAWTTFMNGFLDFFLNIGEKVMPGSIMLFAAVFEFKYLIAMIILGALYACAHLGYIALDTAEDFYGEGRKLVRKIEEDMFNKSLDEQNTIEQKRLKRYQIYIATQVKPAYAHRDYNINLEEQNQILIKHLMEKTGICPDKYEGGFLFTFNSFGKIDEILDIFMKLRESKAPIDYVICVQIMGANMQKETEELKTLIGLKILNKITMLADTAYRYEFNDIRSYATSQVGLFQKGTDSLEVHEFIKKN